MAGQSQGDAEALFNAFTGLAGLDVNTLFASFPDEVKLLAVALAQLLNLVSGESRFHLTTALGARTFGGVGGDLVIRVPRRQAEHVVVKWVGGGVAAL